MKTTKKKTAFKIISLILAVLMAVGTLSMAVFASNTEGYIYLSISYDANYINDKDGNAIIYRPIAMSDIAAVDLTEYGLDHMLYDADDDGDYETTALQLLIYAHEEIYGGDWGEVNFDDIPGSCYFKGGIFGFTENLMYFHNGDFPVDDAQTEAAGGYMTVGATADHIVLEAGDFLDVASFECYSFLWDTLGGFHFFADEDGNFSHDLEADAGETLYAKLMHSFCDLMYGEAYLYGAADYEVFYGKTYGVVEGSVETDGDGNFELAIDEPGTYYIWCYGENGSEDGTHVSCDYYSTTGEPCIVSAPGFAKLTVKGSGQSQNPTTSSTTSEPPVTSSTTSSEPPVASSTPETSSQPEQPREPQSVTAVLNATMAQLATTVSAPSFGTNAGEWTVFSLARGGYFATGHQYYSDYYDRIVETVNETASAVNQNGSLDKNKSTENSRLIVALSAIGKDARTVGDWDLVEAYSANGINWIKKQGMNGTIWTLIALDSGNYDTSDPTIRQQCVDAIVSARHDDGGWSLVTAKAQPSNVDITCMTLTALYPYRNLPAVAEACAEAIEWLSESQLSTGGFPYGKGETSESCAWAIVALTTWGINPDTDPRFIKNGNSAVDNLLTYYIEEEAMFAHAGTESNAMATDQACYALVAYDRFLNNKTALYDYSDVEFENGSGQMCNTQVGVTLSLPQKVENLSGTTFNGVLSATGWDNEGAFKLVDMIVNVPEGLEVSKVTAGRRLMGGTLSYNLDAGKLRIVYFDANTNNDITINGNLFPAELLTIQFVVDDVSTKDILAISLEEMSVKRSSDYTDDQSKIQVETESVGGEITVVEGRTFTAKELYQGDGVDLISVGKKAVAVSVTSLDEAKELIFNNSETEIRFAYNEEISNKVGIATYVALVDAAIELSAFEDAENYTITDEKADQLVFGDINNDGVINAQDALGVVDMWLRKTDAPTDFEILTANVNGDSRINTFDALGIVESFVYDDRVYVVVANALAAK